jgi:proteic killer suppression protein
MKIEFGSTKLQKSLSSEKELQKTYGAIRAKKLKIRLKVLENAINLQEVPRQPPDRCHQLKGGLQGHFAVDLDHPFRLIFKPNEPVPKLPDNSIDLKNVTSIVIVAVEDYHD